MTNEDRLGVNDGNSKQLAVQALSFAQQIINGFVAGSACALFALGFTLMFSVLGVINLTYGFYFSAGAYIALFATLKGASHARPALIRPSLRAAFSAGGTRNPQAARTPSAFRCARFLRSLQGEAK